MAAMDDCPFTDDLPINVVILHSCVKLPEGSWDLNLKILPDNNPKSLKLGESDSKILVNFPILSGI